MENTKTNRVSEWIEDNFELAMLASVYGTAVVTAIGSLFIYNRHLQKIYASVASVADATIAALTSKKK